MSGPPVVSGVSPKEGLPGTKIIIRGENLGTGKDDIKSILICGINCVDSLEYANSKKLICYTPKVIGSGDIIVSTFSGGAGSCNVSFLGLEPEAAPVLGPLEESDVWMDEDLESLARVFTDKTESPVYTRNLTDPLGHDRSARNVRATSETLGDLFPNASGNLMDENFNPICHLLEKHRYTSFYDLKVGLVSLKREVGMNDLAPIQFMRDNLDAFLQCYDTLSDVNELLIRNESESQGGTLTDRVEELLRYSGQQAKVVFDGILKSKGRADSTRNALTFLQRYRFLFSLPKNIEKNIKNQGYDLVATDYEKAKSLFSNTQVNIFKKVLEEVEKQIANFRADLRQQLLVLPSTLEQQKRLIKYLLELDCEGDPAWDCICNMYLWILRLLYTSKEDLQFPENVRAPGELASLPEQFGPIKEPPPPSLPPRARGSVGREGHSRSISDVSYASTSSYGSQTTASTPVRSRSPDRQSSSREGQRLAGAGGMPALKSTGWGSQSKGDASGPPSRIMFVEEVTEVFCVTLPDLWRLGQAYLKGSLFQGVALLTENQQKLARKCDSNRGKFESKVLDVIEMYTNMVNCALFPDAYEALSEIMREKLGEWHSFDGDVLETLGVWLPQIVRRVRECVSSLEGMGLPEKGICKVQDLVMNVRSLCADTLFQRAAKDIKVLHERKDVWKLHNEEGGMVTILPILFENRVVDVLLSLKEIVNDIHEETLPQVNQEIQETAKEHFAGLLEHFIACIDVLAFHLEDEPSSHENVTASQQQLDQANSVASKQDEHLLILMSNMHYLMIEVVPRLFACFMNHGYPPCLDLQEEVLKDMTTLDDKIFDAYIQRKSESLQGIIEQGMQVGYFDWAEALEPTEVRSYIREILMNLVLIHAEVYAVSALIVPRVMYQLVRILSKDFFYALSEVEAFNVNGVICAFVELVALEDLLAPYLDDESKRNFSLSRKHLGEWDVEGNNRVTEIVEDFKKKTSFQLKCFRVQEIDTQASD